MLFSDDFFNHITQKLDKTKGQMAKELYGGYTYDLALPQGWVDKFARITGQPSWKVPGFFVWLYIGGGPITGQPAPLTLDACKWLKSYEDVMVLVKDGTSFELFYHDSGHVGPYSDFATALDGAIKRLNDTSGKSITIVARDNPGFPVHRVYHQPMSDQRYEVKQLAINSGAWWDGQR